jgi:hypothetical protein
MAAEVMHPLRTGEGNGNRNPASQNERLKRQTELNPRTRKKEISGVVALAGLLFLMQFCASCHSTAPFRSVDLSEPGWRVQEGQALWRPRRGMPELGGDLVMVSHDDGRCTIEFSKTPLSLVSAQTTHTNWLIQFPAGRMSFAGRRQPPVRFAWLYLHTALAGEPLPKPLHFERKPDGNWRLENASSGETLEGFLAP